MSRPHGVFGGDVGHDGEGAPAAGSDQLGDLLDLVRPTSREHHIGAGVGQAQHDPATDSAPGSGDHRHLVVDAKAVQEIGAFVGGGVPELRVTHDVVILAPRSEQNHGERGRLG